MSNPLISIVIPSYNSERYIRECLESLRTAKSDRVECILVDGGSSDNTMSIVEDYRELFSVIISEQDEGQSDAFNKGFNLAKGEYFTWLNSDDVFCPGALSLVLKRIELRDSEWYAANVVYLDEHSRITRCCQSGSFEEWALPFGILNVFGPSTVFSRKLYEELGGFREDFHYCMDTEYWWRIARSGIRYKRIPVYLWALRLHKAAKTAAVVTQGPSARPPRMVEENERYRQMYFPYISDRNRTRGVWLVRFWRVLNLSYLRSHMRTLRYRGKLISSMKNS